MQTTIRGILVLILVDSVTVSSAQLPPEIMADAYLLQAEQAVRDGDLDRGRTVIRKIRSLQEQHELDLPDEFCLRFAKAAVALGMPDVVLESIVTYLAATEREGQHYDEALAMMNSVQSVSSAIDVSARISPNIRADAHLASAEKAIGDGDLDRARIAIQDIRKLLQQHELDLSETFHFRFAQAANSIELPEQALESVMKYLAVSGREGQHYVEALELMNRAQVALSCRGWDTEGYFKTATVDEVMACLHTGIDAKTTDQSGVTTLHRAARYSENADVIRSLLSSGVDKEARDSDERTPLHWAVQYDNAVTIEALIEAGADPSVRDKHWQTPLLEAAKKTKNGEVIKSLLNAGADKEASDNDERTPLDVASQSNNLIAMAALIKGEAILEAKDEYGRTALYHAIEKGHSAAIEMLLRAGADRAYVKPEWTVLHWSVTYNESPAAIKAVLKAGAKLKARDRQKNRPIHLAAKFNRNPNVVRELILAGADVNARDRWKRRPLHEAAKFNENPDVARVLIDAGADPNARDEDGNTPLLLASRNNDAPGVIKALIVAGADLDARHEYLNYSPLHFAAKYNNADVVKLLLDAGADPNARHENGDTPLYLAARNNDTPGVIKVLTDAGADPNGRNEEGDTLLHLAAKNNDAPGVIKALMDAGADPDSRDERGSTPLHVAASANPNPEVIRLLIDAGSSPNARDIGGFTPLHDAALRSNFHVVKLLLDAGADPNAMGEEMWTPLHAAAHDNDPNVVKLLLDAGADPNAMYKNKWTPLHLAASSNENPNVVRILIEAGADPLVRDSNGQTPLDLAIDENENPEVSRVLRDAGSTRTKTVAKTEPESKKGIDWTKVAVGVLGGAAIVHAGKDAPSEVTEQVLADWIDVMTEEETSTEAPTASGAASPQTQDDPAQDRMQQALQNLESVCGEKYRSGFAANDHARFYCLAAFNDYCALKRVQTEEAKRKLRASLTRNCGVLRNAGAAGKCSYCQ